MPKGSLEKEPAATATLEAPQSPCSAALDALASLDRNAPDYHKHIMQL